MSRGLNKAMLIGNVGADPDYRSTTRTTVAKLSLATNRTWKDAQGNKQEDVEWHRLTFFGKLADIVDKYVSKGDRIYAEGRFHYSTTDDDGVTRYWTEIIVEQMIMLGSPNGGGRSGEPWPEEESGPPVSSEPADDLPF